MGVFGNDPINAEETGVDGVRELLRLPLISLVREGIDTRLDSWYREALQTRMMKLGIGEGRSAQGMSDPPSQLIGQEYQDVMG